MRLTDGADMDTVGGVLSTVKVVLAAGAAAVLPAVSEAVPAARVMPRVPSPVMPLIVTVLDPVPAPDTVAVPSAVPVLLSVIFPSASITLSAPVYVMV